MFSILACMIGMCSLRILYHNLIALCSAKANAQGSPTKGKHTETVRYFWRRSSLITDTILTQLLLVQKCHYFENSSNSLSEKMP